MWSRFKTFDPWLIILPVILSVISVIFIYILTFDRSGGALAMRQGIIAGVGLIGMLVLSVLDYRSLKAWRFWLYGGLLLALLAVRLFGETVFGAKSWIVIAGFQFQPSEFGKIIVVIVLSAMLQSKARFLPGKQFFLSVLLGLIPVGMVLLQPDLGTSMIIAMIIFVIALHAKLSRLQRGLVIGAFVLIVAVIGASFKDISPFGGLLKDYQKKRFASFIDPEADKSGSGYNVSQSKIAVGSGGLLGRGLGYGSQSQLNFLPVVHADFIFAAIAEAWGLVGSYSILGLFIFLIVRLLNAARISQDEFGSLLCIGMATMLLFQVVVNVGMNIGLMPVTGIPLPFLSYGGTAILAYFLGLGIVQSVVIRSKRLTF